MLMQGTPNGGSRSASAKSILVIGLAYSYIPCSICRADPEVW